MQTQGVLPAQVIGLTRSTIGKKVIMAVTGLIWVGFVFFHMYGNLKVFLGLEYFNEYAEGLRTIGAPIFGHLHLLTVARLGLIVAVVLHVWAAVSLTRAAQVARPQRYSTWKATQATFSSMTMRYGGLAILLFLIYHLMHFTWGTPMINNAFVSGDPYTNVYNGFQYGLVVLIYLLGVTALGLHLYHGTWSMFQTLGLNNRTYTRMIRVIALLLSLVISVGFAIVPLSIFFKFIS